MSFIKEHVLPITIITIVIALVLYAYASGKFSSDYNGTISPNLIYLL